MNISSWFAEYWPLLLLAAWFGHKWWNSRRVRALLPTLRAQGAVMVDVRSKAEFDSANAPGSINIPLQELGQRFGEISRVTPVVVCCASGTRSAMAAALLRRHGFAPVYNAGAWSTLLH